MGVPQPSRAALAPRKPRERGRRFVSAQEAADVFEILRREREEFSRLDEGVGLARTHLQEVQKKREDVLAKIKVLEFAVADGFGLELQESPWSNSDDQGDYE